MCIIAAIIEKTGWQIVDMLSTYELYIFLFVCLMECIANLTSYTFISLFITDYLAVSFHYHSGFCGTNHETYFGEFGTHSFVLVK